MASVPEPEVATVTPFPGNDMVEVPVPLRRGVVAKVWLPTDLTEREAKRVAKIVEAFGGSGQPQLPPGDSKES